jgi:gluconokinase
MASGRPLDDGDRAPWLAAMAAGIGDWLGRERPTILACSALKAAYRGVLAGGRPGVAFVHLTGDPALIAARMAARTDHYMPPTLLPSQLAILEPPEDAVTVAIDRDPDGTGRRSPPAPGPLGRPVHNPATRLPPDHLLLPPGPDFGGNHDVG